MNETIASNPYPASMHNICFSKESQLIEVMGEKPALHVQCHLAVHRLDGGGHRQGECMGECIGECMGEVR